MDAGHLLSRARQRAGMSLRELAAAAATSHPTLVAYEQGRKDPRAETLIRILRASGVELDIHPSRRLTGDARQRRSRELLDVLALADAYPLERTGPLDAPVFGMHAGAASRATP